MSESSAPLVRRFLLASSVCLALGCSVGVSDHQGPEADELGTSRDEIIFKKFEPPFGGSFCEDCWFPVPQHLKFTRSVAECAAHSGPDMLGLAALFCRQTIVNGNLPLVWDFPKWTIDRFRIYEVTPAGNIERTQNPPDVTLYVAPNPKPNTCYIVEAEQGTKKSQATVCTPSEISPPTRHERIFTAFRRTFVNSDDNFFGSADGLHASLRDWPSNLGVSVGFRTRYNDLIWPVKDTWFWGFARGGVLFDVSSLSHRDIVSARFQITAHRSLPAESKSCATELLIADAPLDTAGMPGGELFAELAREVQPKFDVTSTVMAWAKGYEPNHGFVLKSWHEGKADHDEDCLTDYVDPLLEVTYIRPLGE